MNASTIPALPGLVTILLAVVLAAGPQPLAAAGPQDYRPATILAGTAPDYPRHARDREYEGVVHLDVEIARTGRVAAVRVERSTAHPVLEYAAMRAVRKWRFRPAMEGNSPVSSRLLVPIRFSLSEGDRVYPGLVRWN